jgi:hypothetical protein
VVAAQFKAGKTTLIGNTCRSLVDGDPFLGRYHTTPITGSVALLDFEMSERQLDAWLRAQRIRNDDQVIPIPFRGQAAAFNILDPEIRVQWAERLRERRTSYVILDCLRPIFDAIGLDENSEAGRFLVAFDGLLNDAGITEALVVHHMGHSGERSRGDSRIRDWPDVEWRLVRQDERASSARYLTAYGRDVDVSECQLAYDAETRRLTIGGGSRHDAKVERALQAILEVLNSKSASPPSGRAIKGALKETEHKRDDIDLALKLGIERDVLDFDPGSKNSKLYRQKPAPSGVSAKCPPDTASECPGAYISPDTRTLADAVVNIDDYRTLKNGIEDGDGYRV